MTSPATCFPFGRCWGCEERVGGLWGVGGEVKAEGFGQLKDGRLQGKGVNEACSRRNLPQCVIS